ncbi:unnamed protein product [Urochloa decumbens]|uniref:Uncharacterized protein n=1 Tax=Urochloa decumbens TaxID=240449 RepID=A0ABC8VWL7_9POAL
MASRPLLVLLATVSMLFVMASGGWEPFGWSAIFCSRTGDLYANGSQYKKNLNKLLATLPGAARNNSWFYKGSTGAGSNEVFGLIMCFADYNTAQCRYCLDDAAGTVNTACQGSWNATAAYDECMVRYSATPIQATADLGSFYGKYVYGEPVTSQGLDDALLRLMAKLMAGVTASPLLLAIVSVPYSSSQTMYGLAQCTRDLNTTECRRCIDHYADRLGILFPNKTGGAMKGRSCYLRYQVGAFQNTLLPVPPQHHEPSSKGLLAIILSIEAAFMIVLASWILLHRLRRRKRARIHNEGREHQELELEEIIVDDPAMEEEFERGTGPKRFRYRELADATNDFSDSQKLGQGGFGSVYRGFLREMNLHVAIKRVSEGSNQGWNEYASEVKVISRLRHLNLVQLIGWCHERGDELLLVYELMPKGSLDMHLHQNTSNGATPFPWPVRHEIVLGIGSALLYLHQDWDQCVLHRDIKPSNVMLDASFTAKLGDFGLARFVDHGRRSHTTVPAGTAGYMAPECMITGRASTESDVYSFGVVLLEIACSRRPVVTLPGGGTVRLVQRVRDLFLAGRVLEAADARLGREYAEEMERVMVVGLCCAHPDRRLRPSIRLAVNALRGEAPLQSLSARMPVATNVPMPMPPGDEDDNGSIRTDTMYLSYT